MKGIFLVFLFAFCNLYAAFAPVTSYWGFAIRKIMPEPVSNNAVSFYNGTYYSFGGIDSTQKWDGIHGKVFKFNHDSFSVKSIGNWPDSLGKIGVGSSVVKDKIYVIGGYTVDAMGGEVSSDKVHVFDPTSDTFLADGAPIPLPIDDHVQAVYKDSLIYVVTGWSNTGHVPNVQIYNPALDSWNVGTPVPNNNNYLAFGACGVIHESTIYYFGGARPGLNFPLSTNIRIGKIDSIDPTIISWSDTSFFPSTGRYRGGITKLGNDTIMLIGGSRETFNYDGLSYSNNLPVNQQRCLFIDLGNFKNLTNDYDWAPWVEGAIMDLRFQSSKAIPFDDLRVLGGIGSNAKVHDKVYEISLVSSIEEEHSKKDLIYYVSYQPNQIAIDTDLALNFEIYNLSGQKLHHVLNSYELILDYNSYASGIYIIQMESNSQRQAAQVIIP